MPEMDQKSFFNKRFHETMMESGLELCKKVVDVSNEIFEKVLSQSRLPYDLFPLQQFFFSYYTIVLGNYKKIFMGRFFIALQRHEVKDREEFEALYNDVIVNKGKNKEFIDASIDIFENFLIKYCKQEFGYDLNSKDIDDYMQYYRKVVNTEIEIQNYTIYKFLEVNLEQLKVYLDFINVNQIRVKDLFGRYLFSPLEEEVEFVEYNNTRLKKKCFYRELCGPFLKVISLYTLGEVKYQAVNKLLQNNILSTFGKGTVVTKHNFSNFYRNSEFKKNFSNYVMYIIKKLDSTERKENFVNLIYEELKASNIQIDKKIIEQKFYLLMDSWVQFIRIYNSKLLKTFKVEDKLKKMMEKAEKEIDVESKNEELEQDDEVRMF